MQIQTIKYGLNYTKWIKKKQVTPILYSFTHSEMNFLTNFDAQSDFRQISVTKNLLT